MIITEEQRAEMGRVARPLIQWLNENCNPHTQIVVDCTRVELLEGCATYHTYDFLKD